jgi:predicted dehydrogenase
VSPAAARYGIVGSGWRSTFFLRLARQLPERFQVTGVVTRTADRGADVEAEWGVRTFRAIEELVTADRPDFVIVSVPWAVTPEATKDLVARGIAVLAETPPAPDVAGLRDLWATVGASGLVQVAEQYISYPGHAARRALVGEGVIGQPTSAHVSSTHLYHAVSMIRHLLGVGFAPVTVSAQAFSAPLVNPLTPAGWTGDSTPQDLATTVATLDFGGAMGLYDFTDNQWWNPLRSRRIVVRGSHGEIVDDRVVRMADPTTPVESFLVRRQSGIDLNLEGFDLDQVSFEGRVVYRNAFQGARLADDEIAVATLLEQMAQWCRDEAPPPYPLAEACQDHLIGLAIGESVRTKASVTVGQEAWVR